MKFNDEIGNPLFTNIQ